MLTLLKIKNIALIDSLEVEFGEGLNLLTGETGSGKSIIIDSLGAVTGTRVSTDLIKEGEQSATIEGLFSLAKTAGLIEVFDESGIELDDDELIVRRELSMSGKNRVFVNNQLVTQGFLKRIGEFLVDIHGQGDQASLFDPATHREMLDAFADVEAELSRTAGAYAHFSATQKELKAIRQDEADKLQLLDILKFQVEEIQRAGLKLGETTELEDEKRRLNNVEKLSTLSDETYTLLYEQDESTLATLEKAARKVNELAEYDSQFADYREPLETARAVLEDIATTARDFRNHLEFSPTRLGEIENRLADISRLTRKYGGTIDAVLEHLAESELRLENIETAEVRECELQNKLDAERKIYIDAASELHQKRVAAAARFEKEVEANLKTVALEKARFEVRVDAISGHGAAATLRQSVIGTRSSPELPEGGTQNSTVVPIQNVTDGYFTAHGFDRIEFRFSANPGESPKALAKVASGGEASRLMLILKTTSKQRTGEKSAVFDEIDAGIGGRVAEAVGLRLKQLSRTQQVLCVTHQPQVASLADKHFVVEKTMARNKTAISIRQLPEADRVEEIARMLAGEKITDSARKHGAEMIESGRRHSIAETQRRRGAKG
jgi:DNA repair protein RecN (Recombination protein N)